MGNVNTDGTTTSDEAHRSVPARFRRIVARVQARDRNHFEHHPDAWFYWRPAVPGEFGPKLVPAGASVFVLRSPTPLVRVRCCGELVAIDAEGRAAQIAEQLGPPSGMTPVDISAGDVADPLDDRP